MDSTTCAFLQNETFLYNLKKDGSFMTNSPYKRVILKLSGEALAGPKKVGIDPLTVNNIAKEIADAYDLGVEMGIIVGGGKIWRG